MPDPTARTRLQVTADRRAAESLRLLGADLRRLREDAGLSKAAVARVAGIDQRHLDRIESGRVEASASVRARIAATLGAEESVRLFPATGPVIRDRFQARIVEAFLKELPGRWERVVEVPVMRPARGFVDAVLLDPERSLVVAVEAQSEIRRLEQQLRWASEKADALPSSPLWADLTAAFPETPMISRLLLLRSTTSTRDVARQFEATLNAAYPAPASAVLAAIRDVSRPWPCAAIVWVRLDGTRATVLPGRPRGLRR